MLSLLLLSFSPLVKVTLDFVSSSSPSSGAEHHHSIKAVALFLTGHKQDVCMLCDKGNKSFLFVSQHQGRSFDEFLFPSASHPPPGTD